MQVSASSWNPSSDEQKHVELKITTCDKNMIFLNSPRKRSNARCTKERNGWRELWSGNVSKEFHVTAGHRCINGGATTAQTGWCCGSAVLIQRNKLYYQFLLVPRWVCHTTGVLGRARVAFTSGNISIFNTTGDYPAAAPGNNNKSNGYKL